MIAELDLGGFDGGDAGMMASAFVLGLTDVDALTMSTTRSVASGVTIELACRAADLDPETAYDAGHIVRASDFVRSNSCGVFTWRLSGFTSSRP